MSFFNDPFGIKRRREELAAEIARQAKIIADEQLRAREAEIVAKAEADRKEQEANAKPIADIRYENGKLSIKNFNKAFVNDIIDKMGVDLTEGKSDAEIVQLYVERENFEQEEPWLNVVHTGIAEDGRIKMKLDWNHSFINLLKKNGITAETDEEAVQRYLLLLTHNTIDEMVGEGSDKVAPESLTREEIEAAFKDLDKTTSDELAQAEAAFKNRKRNPRRRTTKGSPEA